MRLMARVKGITVSVADIFASLVSSDIAAAARTSINEHQFSNSLEAFTLIKTTDGNLDIILEGVSAQCDVSKGVI